MENPCKNCLVLAVCLKPCEKLNVYAAVIIERENLKAMPAVDAIVYKYWMENIEIRPALKELYFNMKKIHDISLISLDT